jgi:hypothetical protein
MRTRGRHQAGRIRVTSLGRLPGRSPPALSPAASTGESGFRLRRVREIDERMADERHRHVRA